MLDDYHVIEARPIHESLAILVDHLPPALRLVVTSRADPPLPLARWRVRGRLTEIRADDLRFTGEEAAEYLRQAAGQRLSPDEVTLLEQRTEGWIAGLQLAALSLQGQPNPGAFVADFSGSNRYVLDYLTEEILQRQPAEVVSFLLRTAPLERMCAPLCEALMSVGSASLDSQASLDPAAERGETLAPLAGAQAILEHLERHNLFVVALDGERRWYRYHHLFAEVLRNRLRRRHRAVVADLHRRASAWLEDNGSIGEAIQHALAAFDHERAASLVSAHGMDTFLRGQATRLASWLEQIPPAARCAHPPLNLLRALTYMAHSHYAEVEPCLQELEAALPGKPAWDTPGLRAEIGALRAAAQAFLLDPHALTSAQQALQRLPDDHLLRPILLMGLGNAQYASGELHGARDTLQRTLAGLPADDRFLSWRMGLRVTLVFVLLAQGRLREASRVADETAQLAEAVPMLPGAALLQAQLGVIAYERGDLAAAEARLTACLALARSNDGNTAELYARSWLAALRQAQGDASRALDEMERAEALARQHQPTPATLSSLAGRRVYLWLQQGNLAAVADWAATEEAQDGKAALTPFDTHRLARARVLIAQQAYAQAGDLAAGLLRMAEVGGQGLFVLRIQMLLALAHAGRGQRAEAFACLQRALSLAEPEGYVQSFLDEGPRLRSLLAECGPHLDTPSRRAYAEHLVAAFDAAAFGAAHPPQRIGRPSGAEPAAALSRRELEVLRLVAEGHNNQEIAAKLVVAVSTVKKHINAIFGKLNASHRAQAIARARDLGLI